MAIFGFGKSKTGASEAEIDGRSSWAQQIRQGLARTRGQFTEGLAGLLLGKKSLDDDLLEALETQLLSADVGIEATQHILDLLVARLGRQALKDSEVILSELHRILVEQLQPIEQPLVLADQKPQVILVVGVNGVGKTTTIGKLAKRLQSEGKSVMLAAGDTFRAAATEQLQSWGERHQIPVIAQHSGADSASVLFDAVQAATARGVDVVIADTAGRLHNKDHLMNELVKVVRVMKKIDATAPHEVLLVLDAGTGQNAISQAKVFTEAVAVTGLVLTKLDGTAKGGVIFALAKQLALPVRFIGVGEQAKDLQPFKADVFVEALLDTHL